MSTLARKRLAQERKDWRRNHPHGMVAKPVKLPDGSVNLMKWKCRIPGKKGSVWEGGIYDVELSFTEKYPAAAPNVQFTPPLFHPNVYQSGHVCLSLLGSDWKPSIAIPQIMIGLQELLDSPNVADPANAPANMMYTKKRKAYEDRIRKYAKEHAPNDLE